MGQFLKCVYAHFGRMLECRNLVYWLVCCKAHMHFGSILEYINLVYFFMGQFLKLVYAFRKYTRIPESSILTYAFRKYTGIPKSSIPFHGPIFETCICISEGELNTGIWYTSSWVSFCKRHTCISEVYATEPFAYTTSKVYASGPHVWSFASQWV